jgi:glutamyl-tRNA synthetase
MLRSDGTPTYMLAVVVDDHDMGVTHIIRGDDHLTNAARQTHLQGAGLGGAGDGAHPADPRTDGAKLSKRHGALGVEPTAQMGYLPEALRNYLVRLGWSQGDRSVLDRGDDRAFDLDRCRPRPPRFDFVKLENINGHYIRARCPSASTR